MSVVARHGPEIQGYKAERLPYSRCEIKNIIGRDQGGGGGDGGQGGSNPIANICENCGKIAVQ